MGSLFWWGEEKKSAVIVRPVGVDKRTIDQFVKPSA